ncbi:nucleotidyltransferase family protein [soil metagenome]
MIFAAGLGTRLRPLTNDRPKALVEIGGVPVLERVARRLIDAGADRLIINMHHFPDRIRELVHDRNSFGVEVHLSLEVDRPLDTGGGLWQAAALFRRDMPFFVHNCDVLSDFDLGALYRAHTAAHDIATLAVLPGGADRYLLFDDAGLCGYAPRGGGDDICTRDPVGEPQRRDFTGIHVVSPELLDTLPGTGAYSIVTHYLDLAKQGMRIGRHEQPDARWIDIGSHEKLAVAQQEFA